MLNTVSRKPFAVVIALWIKNINLEFKSFMILLLDTDNVECRIMKAICSCHDLMNKGKDV